jgi:hypothetical protein
MGPDSRGLFHTSPSAKTCWAPCRELPLEVYQVLQTAQACRPANAKRVDAVVYVPDASGKRIYNVLIEVKSTTDPKYVREQTRTALKNQVSNAKISFIAVDKSPDKDIRFDPRIFQALNRNEKDGKQWRMDEYLNARIFSVYVNGSYKVVLKPIDGKTSEDPLADRLIFVINLEEINNISHAVEKFSRLSGIILRVRDKRIKCSDNVYLTS